MNVLLELRQLSRWFHRHEPAAVLAVNQVHLQLADGDFAVVVGPNGSGKTTLLNLIAGTLFPDQGSVLVDGLDITHWPDYRRSRLMARIFQDPMHGTAPELTVLDNFRLSFLRPKPKLLRWGTGLAFRKQVYDYIKELGMGLERYLDKEVRLLSGGQRQAIALLMATFNPPRLLLMDEPTAALDPRTSETVMQLADQLIQRHHLSCLMVTHNLKHALQYGNRLLVMGNGSIVADYPASPKKTLTLSDLQQYFY
ncbi:MAG: ATP-binding cassette domain-containing protein [Chitinophagales bacterium]|nr:ATP-binding cassette domain-containing protein [Chitinophagales bacterium]MDW8428318.1 ATP-binding cassette domain-containing protein [Chitinophagales bacterium]